MTDPKPSHEDTEHREALEIESSDNEEEHFSDASEGHVHAKDSEKLPPVSTTEIESASNPSSPGEVRGPTAGNSGLGDEAPNKADILLEDSEDAFAGEVSAPTIAPQNTKSQPFMDNQLPDIPSHDTEYSDPETTAVSTSDEQQINPQNLIADNPPAIQTQTVEEANQEGQTTVEPESGSLSSQDPERIAAEGEGVHTPSVELSGDFDPATVEGVEHLSLQESGAVPSTDATGFEEPADDFDDFEEGENDDDFGDFDDAFQEPPVSENIETTVPSSVPQTPQFTGGGSPLEVIDFGELHSLEDVLNKTEEHFETLFPVDLPELPSLELSPEENPIFFTERSASLWSQLAAPPPLQPPNWVRSRIRRLFLVSLGVPVDLDEILPASKQKKLVLPSIKSPRPSFDGRRDGSPTKQADGSSQAPNAGSSESRKRRDDPQLPELDLPSTKMLCTTTEAALLNLTDDELRSHVQKLEDLIGKAGKVLEYWLKRKDSAVGDKEVFEGVIENLVKHARNVRK